MTPAAIGAMRERRRMTIAPDPGFDLLRAYDLFDFGDSGMSPIKDIRPPKFANFE
jgi:hypothetical protein